MNQPDQLLTPPVPIPQTLSDYKQRLAFVQNELMDDRERLSKAKDLNEAPAIIDLILYEIMVLEHAVDRYQSWIKILQQKTKTS